MAGENRVRIIASLKDDVSKSLGAMNKQFDALGVRTGKAKDALGKLSASTGGLVTPTNLAAAAGLALAGVLFESTRKAGEEEIGIKRLGASLRANVPNWNGNTAAIEETIKATERLSGFSDNELRASFALIVGATHDVNEAFKVQATAMDLARFKGISLEEASQALTKVEAGSYRVLKSLGIQLKDGATQTEALAAVQRVAGGQMESYAESAAGAQDKLRNSIENLEESIGRFLLPTLRELSDSLTTVVDGTDDLFKSLDKLDPKIGQLSRDIGGLFSSSIIGIFGQVHKVITDARGALDQFFDDLIFHAGPASDSLTVAQAAAAKLADHSLDAAEGMKSAASAAGALTTQASTLGLMIGQVNLGFRHLKDALSDFYGAASTFAHEAVLRDALRDDKDALRKLEKAYKEGKISAHDYREGVHQLSEAILSDKQALLDNAAAQAKLGKSQDLAKWIAAQRHNWNRLTEAEKEAVREAEKYVYYLKLAKDMAAGGNKAGKASGGPVYAGTAYTVGERGPETFIPAISGTIVPNGGGGAGGGAEVIHVHVWLDGRQIYESVDKRQAQRLRTTPWVA